MKNNLSIAWENDDLVAIHKPAGLLTIPDRWNKEIPNAMSYLKQHYPQIFTIHRIDRETSGLVLFAKNAMAHKSLNEQFDKRGIRKVYDVLVHGRLEAAEGTIDGPIAEDLNNPGKMTAHPKGKPAQTHYRLMEQLGNYAYVQAQPVTGRTHQIRVHFQDIGHPLMVDPVYGGQNEFFLSSVKKNYKNSESEKPLLSRISLHARKLTFTLPGTNAEMVIEVEMPKDMLSVIQQLRKLNL